MVEDKSIVDNWIVLTLTNVNPSVDSTCTLFKTPSTNPQISPVCIGQLIASYTGDNFSGKVTIVYTELGSSTPISYVSDELADIDALITLLDTLFSSNGGSTSYYTEPINNVYNVYFYSSYYTLVSMTPNTGIINAVDLNQNVILGSFVNVTVESSDISYDELCSELQYQPYLLNWVSVYANTLEQANVQFSMDNKENTGKLYQEYQRPALNPMFRQFVNLGVPINFSPSSTHILQYSVRAGESVKLIFGYTHKELLTIPEKTVFVPKKEIENIEKIIIVHKEHDVPLMQLVKQAIYNPNGNFLKKIIRPFVNNDRIIKKEEVYSAFIGTDFKEID